MALATAELVYGFGSLGYGDWWGFDLDIYRDATIRLFSGQSWFLGRQLGGPYNIANGDVLYPPVASLGFAPFLVFPTVAFVAIPAAIVAWAVWRWRPSPLGWAVIAVCLAWPTTQMRTISANPAVWMTAFLALGLRYRWPAALILLKPSLLPFALVGARSRGWWLVVASLSVASLLVLEDTLRFPAVLLNARGGGITYSLPDVPMLLIPLAAYFLRDLAHDGAGGTGRRSRPATRVGSRRAPGDAETPPPGM